MTTKEQIYLYVYNSINPELFKTSLFKGVDNFSDFMKILEPAFRYRSISEAVILDKLFSLKNYGDLAEFLDRFFIWDKITFSIRGLHSYFLRICKSPISNYNNHKIVKLPILNYDY